MSSYKSDVKLGERYRDNHTGFEGAATNIAFFEHGCERATLKGMDAQGRIVEYGFDSPELTHIDTGKTPVARDVGGPHGIAPVSR